jgi:parallel beta-helix repeat protein
MILGCGDDSNGTGGSGATGGSGGAGATGGAGGGFPVVTCPDDIPDLTAYSVDDYWEVPETATDDCTETVSGDDVNSNNLNAIVAGADIGDIICIAEGSYMLTDRITIGQVSGLTVKGLGASPDDTILDFTNGNAEGFFVSQDNTTLENMWIRNTTLNAAEQANVSRSVFRKIHASWDKNGDNMSANGAYALYPTDCMDTLVEYNQLQGASDAGIYVGKCGWDNDVDGGGLVQFNVVHENVLGLEVENSRTVEVHDNLMINNAAGALSLQQPFSEEKPSNSDVVWFDNRSYCNNHPNFAATGVAAITPAGIGLLVYSGDGQEFYDNDIQGNQFGGVLIISNTLICNFTTDTDCPPYPWPGYVPYALNIYVHDNHYADNGTDTAASNSPFGALFGILGVGTAENPVEDVVWDGYIYPQVTDPGICLGEDNTASYRDLSQNQCIAETEAAILGCMADNNTTETTGRLCTPTP